METRKNYVIPDQARKDILWWYLFLPDFQGTGIMWLIDVYEIDAEIAIDACLKGARGVSGQEFFRVAFPLKILGEGTSIAHLELWAVIIGVRLWGSRCTGKIIRVKSDNEAVTTIINTGRSSDLKLQELLRELTWWLAKYQFRIKSVHIKGSANLLPDLLSRWGEGSKVHQTFAEAIKRKNMSRVQVDKKWFDFVHLW